MRLSLPYGEHDVISVDIPEDNLGGVVGPNTVERGKEDIGWALDHPFGMGLDEFLAGGENIVFIVNDATRPTPTREVLSHLKDRMDLSRATYLVATGAHRAPSEDEYRYIFGELLDVLRERIVPHDARNDETVFLGTSQNGTEMYVNGLAVKADRLIIITSVEPHYFAGYTGGRKSFLPGVASFKTIEQNHRLAMRPEAQTLRLDGNPVHEDMMDALSIVKKDIFSVQVVLDRDHRIYKAAAGELHAAFARAVEWADEVFSVLVPRRYDAVISLAPFPMDIDLYQSQKAIDNAKWALKDGGTLVLVSKCRCGLGDETFCHQLSRSKDPKDVLRMLDQEYRLGYHKAAKMAEIMCTADIWAVTDLEEDELTRINIVPVPTVQEAVDRILLKDPVAKILVLKDGSVTVPRVGSHV